MQAKGMQKPFQGMQRPFHKANLSYSSLRGRFQVVAAISVRRSSKVQDAEATILDALSGARGRGRAGLAPEQEAALNSAVELLEADGGCSDPTTLPELDGRWRLLYTSRPGTSSPIQRTFVGVDAFSVWQEVQLSGKGQPRVNNVVEFGANIGYLKVEAEASIDTRPLQGFTPRQDEGLPLFGRSFNYPPARPNMRIDFQFDSAAFYFNALPFTLPYPVPFRILGDERKGWIDNTYVSNDCTFRLARGNKGTLFVLSKDVPVVERLLAAVAQGDEAKVLELIEQAEAQNPTPQPARSPAANGTWRLVWSQQAADANALQKLGSAQSRNFQVIDGDGGRLENVVDLGFAQIRAQAVCSAASDTRTDVDIGGGTLKLGALQLPLPVSGSGYVDWLYLDARVRVTRGSKGSLFVHVREESV